MKVEDFELFESKCLGGTVEETMALDGDTSTAGEIVFESTPVEFNAQISELAIEDGDTRQSIWIKTADGEIYIFIQQEDYSWIRE